jgi:hypothetical protein
MSRSTMFLTADGEADVRLIDALRRPRSRGSCRTSANARHHSAERHEVCARRQGTSSSVPTGIGMHCLRHAVGTARRPARRSAVPVRASGSRAGSSRDVPSLITLGAASAHTLTYQRKRA